jgi:hypothetical protein
VRNLPVAMHVHEKQAEPVDDDCIGVAGISSNNQDHTLSGIQVAPVL